MRSNPNARFLTVVLGITTGFACGRAGDTPSGDVDVVLEDAAFIAALTQGEGEALEDVPDGDATDIADELLDDHDAEAPDVLWDCSLGAVKRRVRAAYDSDGDGRLNDEERAALHQDMGDGPQARRVRRWARHHRLGRLMWIYDADESRSLSDEEREELRQDLEMRCLHRQARLLQEFDDGDGALDETELQTAHDALRERARARHQAIFDVADTDGDGHLGTGERRTAREQMRQRIQERRNALVAEFDEDDSGTLDATERAALREALKARIRGEDLGSDP